MNAISTTHSIPPDGEPSSAVLHRYLLHPMIMSLPTAFLLGALISDLWFVAVRAEFWAVCSLFLMVDGLVMVVITSIFGMVNFVDKPRAPRLLNRARNLLVASFRFAGTTALLVVVAANLYLRWNDVADAIVPTGLLLSAVAVWLRVATGLLGGQPSYRQRLYRYRAASRY